MQHKEHKKEHKEHKANWPQRTQKRNSKVSNEKRYIYFRGETDSVRFRGNVVLELINKSVAFRARGWQINITIFWRLMLVHRALRSAVLANAHHLGTGMGGRTEKVGIPVSRSTIFRVTFASCRPTWLNPHSSFACPRRSPW